MLWSLIALTKYLDFYYHIDVIAKAMDYSWVIIYSVFWTIMPVLPSLRIYFLFFIYFDR